jgi:hypothetical protein
MKKELFSGLKVFSLIILFLSTIFSIANAQEANVYIPTFKVEKPQYVMGDNIKGEFGIDNNANVRQSDVIIKISSYFEKDGKVILVDEKTYDTIYLEAASKRVVPFNYMLPKGVAGKAFLTVEAYSGNGAILGRNKVNISVLGKSEKDLVGFTDSYLSIGKSKFPLQTGPTIVKGDEISIVYSVGSSTKSFTAKPIVTLYNRTYSSEPIKTISQDSVVFKPNGVYKIKLPSDLDPLVYAGKLSFESENVLIQPMYFRYILQGDIGTILNVNADVLSGDKGDVVNVKVSYSGTPIAFNLKGDDGSNASTTIIVSLYNESGQSVGGGESFVNLSNVGDVVIPINLSEKTDKIFVSAVMKSGDKIISEYKLQLPNEKELNDVYGKKKAFVLDDKILLIIYIVLILILIVSLVAYIKNRNRTLLIVLISSVILMGGLFSYQKVKAFTLFYAPVANEASYFSVSAIFSPGPSSSVSYAPGEEFDLNISATFVACVNDVFNFTVYGPATDWYNYGTSSYASLKTISNVIGDGGSFTNLIASWKNLGGSQIYNSNWGTYKGISYSSWAELVQKTTVTCVKATCKTIPLISYTVLDENYPPNDWTWGKYNGYSEPSWISSSDIQVPYSNLLGAKRYATTENVIIGGVPKTIVSWGVTKYKMPTTPGIYDFMFMLLNDSAGGNTRAPKIVYQTVCVRGAGLCKDEVLIVSSCPNLIGNYTKTGEDIYRDGVITDLYKDAVSGDCLVKNPCYPAVDPEDLGDSCGCVETGVVGTIACNGECQNVSGITIPSDCDESPFSLTCFTNPNPVAKSASLIFSTATSGASGVINSYVWTGDIGSGTPGNNSTLVTSYDTNRSHTASVKATNQANVEAIASCRVWVGCNDNHIDGDGYSGCFDGFESKWQCVGTDWATSSSGIPCDEPEIPTTPPPGDGGELDCPPLDDFIVASGTSKDFFTSRMSSNCSSSTAWCIDGTLKDGTKTANFDSTTYMYKTCVEPVFDEF